MIDESIEIVTTVSEGGKTWTLALGFDRAFVVETDCCQLVGEPRVFPTTLAALDALGLGDPRLTRVDAVRAALAANDLDAARRLVDACSRELPALFDATPAGDWQIRRPMLTTTAQYARFADHIVADFVRAPDEALGRLRQLATFLGVVERPRRGAADSVVTLPIDVVVDGKHVRELPMIAQDDRPDRVFPARDRYAGPTTVVDPLTALYDALMFRCQRIVHLMRLESSIDGEVDGLQQVVDELVAIAQAPPDAVDAWEYTTTRHARVPLSHHGENATGMEPAPAVLWLDAETIATIRGDALVTMSIASGAVVREYPLGGAVVHACDDAGRFVLVGAEAEEYGGHGIGCLDLQTGAWLDELPDHITAVTFGNDELGVWTLYEHRREARMNGAPALCFARGARSVLLSSRNDAIAGHGICATSTLLSEVSSAPLEAAAKRPAPILRADGSFAETADIAAMMQERTLLRAHLPWPAAIARVGERWRFLLPSLHVGDVDRTYFRIGFPIDAASFSPDGTRLLVTGDDLLVIDLPSGAITWRAARPS